MAMFSFRAICFAFTLATANSSFHTLGNSEYDRHAVLNFWYRRDVFQVSVVKYYWLGKNYFFLCLYMRPEAE